MFDRHPSQPKGDILVIDDTPENLALLSNILEERGYKVRSVTKGSAGLRGSQAAPPDLILLDIWMPELNGYEVCRQLKADDRTRDIPVIFISALGETIDKVKAFAVGGVDYITKPFQVEEVLARIDTHLSLRRLQKQLQSQNNQLRQEIKARLAAQEKFTKAFHFSPSPIAILNLAESRFLEVNPSFLKLSGYTQEEIIDRTLGESELEVRLGSYSRAIEQLSSKGAIYNQEFDIRTKSGEIRTVLLSIETIEIGGISCSLNVIDDITEYKRLENEFISLVSHELRTPMNSLIGSLDLLGTGKLGILTAQGQQILGIAIANTERLMRLVNDILDLERMKSGRISVQKVKCNAADILIHSVEAMQFMAEKEGVILHCESIDVDIVVDPDRIVQTLINLLSNAIKFSEWGQTVWLQGILHPNHLEIQVRDCGRGIPAEQLQRIFEPFQQIDATDSRQKGGSGLGLAICRHIIEQHEGRIWAESVAGRGSIFRIILPRSH
jgi:PAS domain S-box-containing protein